MVFIDIEEYRIDDRFSFFVWPGILDGEIFLLDKLRGSFSLASIIVSKVFTVLWKINVYFGGEKTKSNHCIMYISCRRKIVLGTKTKILKEFVLGWPQLIRISNNNQMSLHFTYVSNRKSSRGSVIIFLHTYLILYFWKITRLSLSWFYTCVSTKTTDIYWRLTVHNKEEQSQRRIN